ERHLPYAPLASALRDAMGDVDLDGQRLPGLRREPSPNGTSEVDALEALVALIAEHAPLALFVDDLHWADDSTIAALSYLQRRCRGLPVALVTALRGEEAEPDHPARRLAPDLHMQVEPLTAADLAPLGIPCLHDTTGGNPRFLTQ